MPATPYLYDKARYAEIEKQVWAEICERERPRPLTGEGFYGLLAELNLRMYHSERELEQETRRRLGARPDHMQLDGTVYSRAYVEANMQQFNWQMVDDEGSYPHAIARKWPEVAAAGRRMLRASCVQPRLI